YPAGFRGVWELVPVAHGADHWVVLLTSLAVLLVGAGTAWQFYRPAATDALEQRSPGLFRLLASKLWFDELYAYLIDKGQQRLAMLLNFLEQIFLAGVIIRGCAGLVGLCGLGVRALHVGRLNAYVYWFLFGLAALWLLAAGLL
ncbi:MAG: NADH-quinone oxidoreductase subunit L, partial [Opitutales bacterium]|nr:NADH-quinone oxidoreductase subunit L [Opitutales bacterium]